MKTHTQLPNSRLLKSRRSAFNPVRSLSPESLIRKLDSFHSGNLAEAARLWETIEQRDDIIKAVSSKRKKSPGRFGWEITTHSNSPKALQHKAALEHFYRSLNCTNAVDENQRGGLNLLLTQMMDAVGKHYAVHEIVWEPRAGQEPMLTASFRFVPLWFFENSTGRLRFQTDQSQTRAESLNEGEWMVTTGEGLMEASSIAYLFKHLPLRDWLVYCERNGMPGVRGTTDATPGSAEWDAAREAVQSFGAEFNALMSHGTDIQAIDLSSSGSLPYPELINRMDQAIATLWRGAPMGTITENGAGISLQARETALIERDDIIQLSETLNKQVDRYVIKHLFNEEPHATIRILPPESQETTQQNPSNFEALTQTLPNKIVELIQAIINTKLCTTK
ncbi:MAG: DUF935 family protein [Verrucomicrobiota bacterium]